MTPKKFKDPQTYILVVYSDSVLIITAILNASWVHITDS